MGEILMRNRRFFALLVLLAALCATTGTQAGKSFAEESFEERLSRALGAVSEEPDKAWARVDLGDVYVALGRCNDAIASYKTALRLDPGNVLAMNGMAYAYLGIRQPEKALPFLLEAIRTDPAKGDLPSLAYVYMTLGMNREALETFDSVLEKDPGNIEMLNSRGQVLFGMGENGKAVESFLAAIRVDPASGEYAYLGYAYSALGMEGKAQEAFRDGIRYRPKDVESLNALGSSLLSRGRIEEAKEFFQEAIMIEPDNADALNGLGYVYSSEEDHSKALESLEKAARIDPLQGDYTAIGYEYAYFGMNEDAADAFRRSIAKAPSAAAEAWHGLGYALLALDRNVEAMDAFRRSYMLMPEPRTLNSLGYAYIVVRNYPNAIEAFKRVLKTDPEDAQARYNLGLVMLDLDRRVEARKYYAELLVIDPLLAADLKKVMDEAWK